MLSGAENGLADFSILLRIGVVDDSDSALVLNGEADQHGHSGEVTLHEVVGSVEGVNPNDSVTGVEACKVLRGDFVCGVVFAEDVVDPLLAQIVLLIQHVGRNEVLDLGGDGRGVDS